MPAIIQPLDLKCNIQCQYCYQNPERDARHAQPPYNLEKIKGTVEKIGGPFSLFGGEPLMLPEKDLRDLWSWGLEKYGSNEIQTNGTLINDTHIEMFKQYRVHVGISVDGPGELNDARWAGTLEQTRQATAKTYAVIERLCKESIPPGLIVTLNRSNATGDKMPVMYEWFKYLEKIGITYARLHILEVTNEFVRRKYALSSEENLSAFLGLLKLEEEELTTLKFDIFQDIRDLLLGEDNATSCVWNACDPYTTQAVEGVGGSGQLSICNSVNRDGIGFTKSNVKSFERYLALYHTPQEYYGCKDCRFFIMCKGECPGTAIDGDWRNRTEYCDVWKGLYQHVEGQLLQEGRIPLSTDPERESLEKVFLNSWATGRNTNIAGALAQLKQRMSITTH